MIGETGVTAMCNVVAVGGPPAELNNEYCNNNWLQLVAFTQCIGQYPYGIIITQLLRAKKLSQC